METKREKTVLVLMGDHTRTVKYFVYDREQLAKTDVEAEVLLLIDAINKHFNDVMLGYDFFIQVKRETKDWGSVFIDCDGSEINDKSVIRIVRNAKPVALVRFHIYADVCRYDSLCYTLGS